MTRREILALIGFKDWQGALRFENIAVTEAAINAMSEPDFDLAVQRWWRRSPAPEVLGDVPDYP
jgi:hypothetical protein